MRIARSFALSGLLLCACLEVLAAASPGRRVETRPEQLRPAFSLWRIGINTASPTLSAETVYPVDVQKRRVWRVSHFGLSTGKPGEAAYDYYDVDAASLRPIVTETRYPRLAPGNDRLYYRIEFDGRQARARQTRDGKTIIDDTQPVPEHLYPEGPGDAVFVGALPLRAGYAIRYSVVNRWVEGMKARHAPRGLRVAREEVVQTRAGRFKTFVLEADEPDGSRTRYWVLAEAPHYKVRVEMLGKKGERMVSEIEQLVIGP